ncbi:BRCT domain-containing protein [Microbulbifer sp. ZKSA006]|uniref:BRCT domain-containing protein n=1 Tax=Microbulbifer sp. ZKSA006 TaxID=3243390 RepID=UPI004039795C
MSEQSFIVVINPKGESNLPEINNLLTSLDHNTYHDLEWCEESGLIRLTFYTGTLFVFEKFVDLLLSSGAADIEASVFNSQCGENSYYKNKECYESYKEVDWNWIESQDPGLDFSNQYIVLTGEFDDYLEDHCKDDLEAIIEEYDGILEEVVSEKTTMLIEGEDPDLNEIASAKKYKIKIITGSEFEGLINEAYEAIDD